MFKPIFVVALAAPLLATPVFTTAPFGARLVCAQQAPTASFDEGKAVSFARDVKVPTSVRRALPRRAQTLLCVAATVEGRAALLHLWNPAKGDSVLDVLAKPKGKSAPRRLKRVSLGRIEPNQIAARVAPLQKGKKGTVIALNWSESQAAGAFSTVPMLAVILPDGLGGKVLTQDLSTESSVGGNVFHSLRVGAQGEAFMLLTNEAFDAGTQQLQRLTWQKTRFAPEGEAVTRPLSSD